jgi:hypothetical protein
MTDSSLREMNECSGSSFFAHSAEFSSIASIASPNLSLDNGAGPMESAVIRKDQGRRHQTPAWPVAATPNRLPSYCAFAAVDMG